MKVTPITIAAALLIAAVVGFASSFIPSYHAAKVNIVDVYKRQAVSGACEDMGNAVAHRSRA